MADHDSFFEIGGLWGTDQVVGFVRFNGYPMGVIASDSRHVNGGALTADGCDKLRRHLDLCDLFHLPVLKQTLDTLRDGFFSPEDRDRYKPIFDNLTYHGDHYLLLA